ncbi:MAG: hypothetical protein Q8O16_00835 [Dehalococcoidia bacterium]|nr:hypothetical protein [Dehalococcoidia bacterium]
MAALTAFLLLAVPYLAHAAGGFALWWGIDSGGAARGSSSFLLSDTVGQGTPPEVSRSQQFTLVSGFQAGSAQPPIHGNTSLAINIIGNGTTSPAAGVNSSPSGTPVIITATPATGWTFSHWSGDASGTSNPITVTMNANKTVTANFAVQGITLIGAIKQNPPAYDGQMVKISGQYRGWEGGHGSSPITRSDWVIMDSTGAIYVTGGSLRLRYTGDLGENVTVSGKVRLKGNQPYIQIVLLP